jgi:hypothetical protein
MIAAGPKTWISRAVLSNPAIVFVGLISYPLYLWHWPVLYFLRTVSFGSVGPLQLAAAVVASFVLATLTYFFIESPLRRRKVRWRSLLVVSTSAAMAMLVIAVGSVWITRNDGFRDRQIATLSPLPREQQQLEAKLLKVFNLRYDYGFAKLYGDKPCFRFKESQTMDLFIQNGCLDKQFPGRPTVFLLGDSHSASLSIGLIPMLSAHEINFPHVSYGWCTPTGDFNDNPICRDMNEKTLAKIEEYKPAVLGRSRRTELHATWHRLRANSARLHFPSQIQGTETHPHCGTNSNLQPLAPGAVDIGLCQERSTNSGANEVCSAIIYRYGCNDAGVAVPEGSNLSFDVRHPLQRRRMSDEGWP